MDNREFDEFLKNGAVIHLSQRDYDYLAAELEKDEEPNEALKQMVEDYKNRFEANEKL